MQFSGVLGVALVGVGVGVPGRQTKPETLYTIRRANQSTYQSCQLQTVLSSQASRSCSHIGRPEGAQREVWDCVGRGGRGFCGMRDSAEVSLGD